MLSFVQICKLNQLEKTIKGWTTAQRLNILQLLIEKRSKGRYALKDINHIFWICCQVKEHKEALNFIQIGSLHDFLS